MSVAEGNGVSAAEIDAIRVAMHGVPLRPTMSRGHNWAGFLRIHRATP